MSFSQLKDYFYYDDRKFMLLAISDNKHLIKCAEFHIPYDVQFSKSTNNWRGYQATYYAEDNKLYGIKNIWAYNEPIYSEKMFLDFTGNCIITDVDVRFGTCYYEYLYCYEAYELKYKHGILQKVNDLSTAIHEFDAWDETKQESKRAIKKLADKYLDGKYRLESYGLKESNYFNKIFPDELR